ncbi:MAG: GxxExxY protein [Rhodospirillales bacterium]|nr:GxxExxY protein [Rhodospirillales bacterium]
MVEENDPLTQTVIGLAIEVHKQLGPGLLESAYEACLCYELSEKGISFDRQVDLPVSYKSIKIGAGYRLDIVVENKLIIELKTVERILPVHESQLLTYLKLSGIRTGLILNFNSAVLKDGIRRLVN